MSFMSHRHLLLACLALSLASPAMTDPPETPTRIYANKLTPIKNPSPLLADHPDVRFNYYRGGIGVVETEMH